jgi:butyrate kinase
MKIFTINPGSTSTKVALFNNDRCIFIKNVKHDAAELANYITLSEQLSYRKETILSILEEENIKLDGCDAFVGRGGGLLSMEGGVYSINETMLDHAANCANGVRHPANLGSLLANEFCQQYGGQAFVVNPPDVDEFQEVARITGIKEINRTSHIHALNQKETAERHAETLGKKYSDCNFVVCHIGGGVSVAAHRMGRMIDGNDIVGGEGPMAPTRAGAVPADQLIRLCFSGKYSQKEMLDKCTKTGGFVDHLGTSDAIEVLEMAEKGNSYAKLIWDAMVYQIIKQIGSMAAALYGKVDGILLGGGMAHNKGLVQTITEASSFIAPVTAYPGEFEMEAMAAGAERGLKGTEEVKTYTGKPVWNGYEKEYVK